MTSFYTKGHGLKTRIRNEKYKLELLTKNNGTQKAIRCKGKKIEQLKQKLEQWKKVNTAVNL